MKPYLSYLIIALLLIAGLSPVLAADAPDFNLHTLEGKRINLKTLLKNGPVLLDFWATYCKPCIKAMPKLQEIHLKYQNRGLTVLGINEDGPRGRNRVKPFLKSRKIDFPIALDSDGGVMRRLQVNALPATFLIAPDGEIVLRQTGYNPERADELLAAIESLLPTPEAKATENGRAEK